MADKTVTLKPSGGTYTTLAAAIAGELIANADLVTMEGKLNIEIGGSWSSPDTTYALINGFTTSATYYVNIYTDSSNRASGPWSANKYNLLVANTDCIGIQDNFVRLDGLQIGHPSVDGHDQIGICILNLSDPNEIHISNCLLQMSTQGTYREPGIYVYDADAIVKIWRTIIYGYDNLSSSGHCAVWVELAATVEIYSSILFGGYHGVRLETVVATVKNCYASNTAGGGNCFDGVDTMVTCASEDNTGTAGLQTIAADTDQFVNVTGGSEDFHLAGVGSALYNVGTDTSGDSAPLNFNTDIDGDAMGATWPVGADQIVGGGAIELVVSSMNIGCTLESPVLTQLHNLIVAGVDVGLTLEAIILDQLHNLSVDGVNVGLTLESPVLTQLHNLIADSINVGLTLESPVLQVGVTLIVDGINIGLTLESPVLTQLHVLTVNGANIGLSLESPSLTQLHVLVVDSIDVGLVLESPVLSIGVVTLVVNGLNVGLTLESPGLTQLHNLTVQDVMIALNLDNVILVTESLVKLGIDPQFWASKHRGPKQITKLSKTGIGMKKAGYPRMEN